LDPQEGKLVLLLNPSCKSAVVADSLPKLSYPLRVVMDLNMVELESCCVKDKVLIDLLSVSKEVRAKGLVGIVDER